MLLTSYNSFKIHGWLLKEVKSLSTSSIKNMNFLHSLIQANWMNHFPKSLPLWPLVIVQNSVFFLATFNHYISMTHIVNALIELHLFMVRQTFCLSFSKKAFNYLFSTWTSTWSCGHQSRYIHIYLLVSNGSLWFI